MKLIDHVHMHRLQVHPRSYSLRIFNFYCSFGETREGLLNLSIAFAVHLRVTLSKCPGENVCAF